MWPARFSPTKRPVLIGTALFGVVISLVLFALFRSEENKRVVLKFDRRVENYGNSFRLRRKAFLDETMKLTEIFEYDHEDNAEEFESAIMHAKGRCPGIRTVAWIPLVAAADRSSLEAKAQVEGRPGFEFICRDATGSYRRAPERPEYLPVWLLSGVRTADFEPGADLLANERVKPLLEEARSVGRKLISAPYPDRGNTPGVRRVTMVSPVFWRPKTASDKTGGFRGFIAVVLDVNEFFEAGLDSLRPLKLNVLVIDETSPDNQFLHYHSWKTNQPPQLPPPKNSGTEIQAEERFNISSRRWTIVYSLEPSELAVFPLASTAVLLAGLFLTGGATLFLSALANHTANVEMEVLDRTARLRESEKQLKCELERSARIQAGLDARERDLKRAQHIAGLVIMKWDWASEQLSFLGEAAAMFGRHNADFQPALDDLINWAVPEDRPMLLSIRDQARGGKEVKPFEYRTVWPNSEERWIRCTMDFILNAEGRACGTVVTGFDVTPLKMVELELRRQREEYSTVFNLVPAYVLTKDTQLRILRVNQTAAEALGLPANEIEGRTYAELAGTAGTAFEDNDRAVIASGCPRFNSIEGLPTNLRGMRWLEIDRLPFKDSHGAVVGLIIFAKDITERVQAEEVVRHRNLQLSILNRFAQKLNASLEPKEILGVLKSLGRDQLDAWGGAIITFDPSGSGELRIDDSWGVPAHELEGLREQILQFENPRSRWEDVLHEEQDSGGRTIIPLQAQGIMLGALLLLNSPATAANPFNSEFYTTLGRAIGAAWLNAQLFQEASESRESLKSLARRLIMVEESERRIIARELHDQIGQLLMALKLQLEAFPEVSANAPISDILNDLVLRVRKMSLELRPTVLDDLGIVPAVAWLIQQFNSRKLTIEFEHMGVERRFDAALETAGFRITQEALANAVRHSNAPRIVIRIWATNALLAVQVDDAGRGFDVEAALAAKQSTGLHGMKERVQMLQGNFLIESAADGGTRVLAEFPLQQEIST